MRAPSAIQRLFLIALATAAALALPGCSAGSDGETPPQVLEAISLQPTSLRPISPLPASPVEDKAKVALGRTLFNDTRLSADGSVSCRSCHDVRAGGDDGRRVSVGVNGRRTSVNAPSVLNSVFDFAYYWDGRARTLEEQIDSTVRNEATMAGDWSTIERRLRGDDALNGRFSEVYGAGVNAERIKDALAAYLGALVTPDSPFDRWLEGDANALAPDARAGYRLFVERGCVSCHQGRNVGGNLFQRFGLMADYFAGRTDLVPADLGRYNVTGNEADRHSFKVPSLRNVAETAPYFHDGSAATLEEAVRVMFDHQLGRPADDAEVARIVAFLRSLSGELDESLL